MQPANSCDLFSILEQVTDPRGRQGHRHSFDAMLAAIICGTLCGIHSMRMIASWVRQLDPSTFHWLGFKRTPSCANTYSTLLEMIDPEEFEQAIRDWIQTLLKWYRSHWGIENRLYWVRDETFGEDRCRVRSGNARQVLAAIRNLTINWLRSQEIGKIAESLRKNAWNPQRFFTQIGKPNF
ncbi:MAG: transposase family protein [Planctomycetaceae bacterium]|nr:transposase family protein [Planctomycetaceae bacterium]